MCPHLGNTTHTVTPWTHTPGVIWILIHYLDNPGSNFSFYSLLLPVTEITSLSWVCTILLLNVRRRFDGEAHEWKTSKSFTEVWAITLLFCDKPHGEAAFCCIVQQWRNDIFSFYASYGLSRISCLVQSDCSSPDEREGVMRRERQRVPSRTDSPSGQLAGSQRFIPDEKAKRSKQDRLASVHLLEPLRPWSLDEKLQQVWESTSRLRSDRSGRYSSQNVKLASFLWPNKGQ